MANIAQLKTGAKTLEILHPGTQEPIGIRVFHVHIDDEKMQTLKRSITNRRNQLEARGKGFKFDEVEENMHNLIRTGVTGWEWYNPTGKEGDEGYDPDAMPDFNGEILEYNTKNLMTMVKGYPWFKDQISVSMGDLAGFFGN